MDVARTVEHRLDEAAPHLRPGRPFVGVQADVAPDLAFGKRACEQHEFARQEHCAGFVRGCGVATRPALAGVVMATGFDGHAHQGLGAFGDQVEFALLGFGIIEITPGGQCIVGCGVAITCGLIVGIVVHS